jgi:hypothetical protein
MIGAGRVDSAGVEFLAAGFGSRLHGHPLRVKARAVNFCIWRRVLPLSRSVRA